MIEKNNMSSTVREPYSIPAAYQTPDSSEFEREALLNPIQADAVVIGAGITGSTNTIEILFETNLFSKAVHLLGLIIHLEVREEIRAGLEEPVVLGDWLGKMAEIGEEQSIAGLVNALEALEKAMYSKIIAWLVGSSRIDRE